MVGIQNLNDNRLILEISEKVNINGFTHILFDIGRVRSILLSVRHGLTDVRMGECMWPIYMGLDAMLLLLHTATAPAATRSPLEISGVRLTNVFCQ